MAQSEFPARGLSARQHEVHALVAQGLTNQQIADVLHISVDTVRSHVSAILTSLGVKNRTEATHLFFADQRHVGAATARTLAEPAIAIWPLQALSDAPAVALAATGFTRDLVALFSRHCFFPVIAPNHAWAAEAERGATTAAEAGRNVGARFVLTGALRKAGPTFRIDVTATDTSSGHTIWTDARDFPASALFEVQDAITASIVAAAYATFLRVASDRLDDMPFHPERASTWELAHHAMSLHLRRERDANARAAAGFRLVLERESGFVLAHYGLGATAYDAVLNQWGDIAEARTTLRTSAARCCELAPHMAEGHFLHARDLMTRADYRAAVPVLETAIETNPSFAAAYALLAQMHTVNGDLDEGLGCMQIANRLGPHSYTAGLAVVHFARMEWDEALRASEAAIGRAAHYPFGIALAAASAYWLGDHDAARGHADALLRAEPTFTTDRFRATFGNQTELVQRVGDALAALSFGS